MIGFPSISRARCAREVLIRINLEAEGLGNWEEMRIFVFDESQCEIYQRRGDDHPGGRDSLPGLLAHAAILAAERPDRKAVPQHADMERQPGDKRAHPRPDARRGRGRETLAQPLHRRDRLQPRAGRTGRDRRPLRHHRHQPDADAARRRGQPDAARRAQGGQCVRTAHRKRAAPLRLPDNLPEPATP